jgi:hypothetical protein
MKKPEVDKLYKYRTVDKFTLDILVSGQIYFPTPARFNDPFDTQCSFKKDFENVSFAEASRIFEDDAENMTIHKYSSKISPRASAFKKELEQFGILSLCATSNNQLLWAHYAMNHTGICIGFKRASNNMLGDDIHTAEVSYIASYPTISASSIKDNNAKKQAQHRVLHSKSELWRYEEEWRCVVSEGDKTYAIPGEISEIIFGCRTTESDKSLIKQIIRGKSINLYQAELKPNQFGLKLTKLK